MARRVLVTRPEPGATATGRRLAWLGFEPVVLPLTEIKPLRIAETTWRKDHAAVVATSANAVRHAPAALLEALSGLPAFAVGDETARAMEIAGLSVPLVADGDAISLAALIANKVQAGTAIAYLAGRVRRDTFEPMLHEAGLAVTAVETYDTVPIVPEPERLAALMTGAPIAAVLVYSALAAEAIAALLAAEPRVAKALADARFIGISQRVSDALPGSLANRARSATQPTEDALMELLRRECRSLP